MLAIIGTAIRWTVVGFCTGIGLEIGKAAFDKLDEDGSITKKVQELTGNITEIFSEERTEETTEI